MKLLRKTRLGVMRVVERLEAAAPGAVMKKVYGDREFALFDDRQIGG